MFFESSRSQPTVRPQSFPPRRPKARLARPAWPVWAAAALLVAGTALAAPAPWYWWVSKVDGQRVCAQHMPSKGWEKAEGPFAQAGCQVQRPRPLLGR